MDYNNKKSDKTYSKLLQEIKKESAILENEYHNTKLRNSDKVVNYVNNENTELRITKKLVPYLDYIQI